MSVPKVVCRRADEQTQWGLGAPLLVAGELYLRRERKYVAVPALLLVLALTRPIALAFIPVMTAHGVGRWRERIASPFSRKDHRAVVFLAAFCIATTGLWLVIVGSSTGTSSPGQEPTRPGGPNFILLQECAGQPASCSTTVGWRSPCLHSSC